MRFWNNQTGTPADLPTKEEMYPSPAPIATPLVSAPASATKATVTVAARAGYRHVCVGILASIAAGATAQTPLNINLIDGASGGSALLASEAVSAPPNQSQVVQVTGISIPGTANTAMTLEFSAAGVLASVEAVTLLYIDVREQ